MKKKNLLREEICEHGFLIFWFFGCSMYQIFFHGEDATYVIATYGFLAIAILAIESYIKQKGIKSFWRELGIIFGIAVIFSVSLATYKYNGHGNTCETQKNITGSTADTK